MRTGELPLEVLGLLGPLLCWVEGTDGFRLPERWVGHRIEPDKRVQAWLVRELPTYSRDSIDEIQRLARRQNTASTPSSQLGAADRNTAAAMEPPPGYDLGDAFARLSDRYFQWSGNELNVKDQRVEELHEVALRFPVRFLIRYRHARAVATGILSAEEALELPVQMSRLHSTAQSIRAVIDRGLTEGHLHLWGVTSADESWADHLLRPISQGARAGFSKNEEDHVERERLLVLSRCAVRMLGLGLLHDRLAGSGEGLPFELVEDLDRVYFAPTPKAEREERVALRLSFLDALKEKARFSGTRPPPSDDDLDWLLALTDPKAHFHWRQGRPFVRPMSLGGHMIAGVRGRLRLIERLHFEVLRRLFELHPATGGGPADDLGQPGQRWRFLHRVFYRYLIYSAHHWHLATQSGRTTGLREFQRFMQSPQRDLLNTDVAEAQGLVFERLSRSAGLKTVEGRVSPPRRGAVDLVPWILAYGKAARQGRIERFGLIVHFLKEADRRGAREARPGSAAEALRSGRIRRHTRQRAFELFRLLATPHPAVPFVVGIDAANLELTTPPEVFAPAFRFLREFPIALRPASSVREIIGGYPEIARLVHRRRLGMTFHVGEDFRHLLSGLRAIHEVVEFLHPRPGDRLGHALALGLDPRVWATTIGYQAVMPREEALDTLVWLHHFLGPGHELLAELSVDDHIQRYARRIYEAPLDRLLAERTRRHEARRQEEDEPGGNPPPGRGSLLPQVLYDAWRLRQLDPYSLDSDQLLDGKGETLPPIDPGEQHRRWHRIQQETLRDLDGRVGSREAFRLLHLYWFDPEVRRSGREIEALDMSLRGRQWMQLCDVAQEKMQRIVERRQLVVEVNPSSNRVVGPMPRLSDHPIFRLTEDEHGKPRRGIRVTINTDDPGVFNTSLAHEYYLLAENRMRQGHTEAEVIEWLEWLRRNGEDSSFVRSLPRWDDPAVAKLLATLKTSYGSLPGRLSGERASAVQVVQRRERGRGAVEHSPSPLR